MKTSTMMTTALAAAAILTIGCRGRPEVKDAAAAPPLPVRVAAAAEASRPGGLIATATIEPWRRATPGTVLMGRVGQVLRREGEVVRAGAVLARIEDRDVMARLAQAESQVAAAQAAEQSARLMRERLERLVARQAAPQRSLEEAIAAHDGARAAVRAAEEGVAAAGVYAGYAQVTAPFAGLITKRMIEVGDMAAPGMPLFVVEDLSKVKVEAPIPESLAASLAPGTGVEVEPAGGAVRTGTLAEILPAADPASRTLIARVVIENADGALRSGTFARVRLGRDGPAALAVPAASIVRRGPLTGVFVVDASETARLRWVALGLEREGLIDVVSGLAPGERIVVEPPADLEDGRKLAVSAAETR